MMMQCSLCSNFLTGIAISQEHIVPNCIGGRKKTSIFICKACNNEFGKKWEKVLSDQFLWFSLTAGIVRERGQLPALKMTVVDGSELLYRNDGSLTLAKPSYSETELGDGKIKIQLSTRTMEEAQKLVKGIRRKYPDSDAQAALDGMVLEQSYLDKPVKIDLQFGGPYAGRSMVKTALALAAECGIDMGACGKSLAYLKDPDPDAPPPFGLCYSTDVVLNRPSDSIFHCVSVAGLPSIGKILGYVEYFNFARILIDLGDEFEGDAFYYSYSIDPTTGVESDIQVDFTRATPELDTILSANGYESEDLKKVVERVMPIVLRKNFERERSRVLENAAQFAFEALGVKPGDTLDPAHVPEFSRIVAGRIAPFLAAHSTGGVPG